jgi:hypothetical protein
MKKIFVILILFSFSIKSYSQKYRVFDVYSVNYGFSSKFHSPSFMMGQSLKIGNTKSFSINSGLNLNFPSISKSLLIDDQYDVSTLNFRKLSLSPSLNIPLGFEIGYGKISIGAITDLFGISFGKKSDSSKIQIEGANISDYEEFQVKNGGVNFILSSKEKRRNLNSQVYVLITPGDTFSVKLGFTAQSVLFNSNYRRNNKIVNYRDYQKLAFMPSIGLNFKIEK